MTNIDWSSIRLQWEVFGEDAKTLAEEYGISPKMVEYAAEENGWSRFPIAETIHAWKGISDPAEINEDLLTDVNTRLKVLQTIRQSVLSPKYIALESAILSRALEIIKTVDPKNETSVDRLKVISEIFKQLMEMTGAGPRSKTEEDEDSGGLSVKILNFVGDKKQYSQEPIEVNIQGQSKKELSDEN